MTDLQRAAEALDQAAEALASAALALRGAVASPDALSGTTAPSFEELPFAEEYDDSGTFEDTPQGRSQAGGCPVHGRPWIVQPGGFSAVKQKSYRAFWKCPATLPNGNFCPERPTLAWVKAHPAR